MNLLLSFVHGRIKKNKSTLESPQNYVFLKTTCDSAASVQKHESPCTPCEELKGLVE